MDFVAAGTRHEYLLFTRQYFYHSLLNILNTSILNQAGARVMSRVWSVDEAWEQTLNPTGFGSPFPFPIIHHSWLSGQLASARLHEPLPSPEGCGPVFDWWIGEWEGGTPMETRDVGGMGDRVRHKKGHNSLWLVFTHPSFLAPKLMTLFTPCSDPHSPIDDNDTLASAATPGQNEQPIEDVVSSQP